MIKTKDIIGLLPTTAHNLIIAQAMEARETPDLLDLSSEMTASSWPPMDMREAGNNKTESQKIH